MAPPRYPVSLAVDGVPVLVVGGGRVGLRKTRDLLECGAEVTVLALRVEDALRSLEGVTVEQRPYEPGEAAGYRLVIAATDDPALNRRISADAAAGGAWANDVTDPDGGAMALPARLRHGRVTVAVSTGGASPALAAWLRDEIGRTVGPEVAVLADLVADARSQAPAGRPQEATTGDVDEPPPDWRAALDSGMLDLIRQGRVLEAKERLQACRSSS